MSSKSKRSEIRTVGENRNCHRCSRTDSADNMVGCDSCETWEHYGCAGVSESIEGEDRSWKCERCRVNSELKEASKSVGGSSVSSRRSQRLELNLKMLEEQKEMRMKQLQQEEEIRKKQLQQEEEIRKKQLEQEEEIRKKQLEKEEEIRKKQREEEEEIRKKQREQEEEMRKKQLEQEEEMRKKRQEEEENFLKQKYELLMAEADKSDDGASRRSKLSNRSSQRRVREWLSRGQTDGVNLIPECSSVQSAPLFPTPGIMVQQDTNPTPSSGNAEHVVSTPIGRIHRPRLASLPTLFQDGLGIPTSASTFRVNTTEAEEVLQVATSESEPVPTTYNVIDISSPTDLFPLSTFDISSPAVSSSTIVPRTRCVPVVNPPRTHCLVPANSSQIVVGMNPVVQSTSAALQLAVLQSQAPAASLNSPAVIDTAPECSSNSAANYRISIPSYADVMRQRENVLPCTSVYLQNNPRTSVTGQGWVGSQPINRTQSVSVQEVSMPSSTFATLNTRTNVVQSWHPVPVQQPGIASRQNVWPMQYPWPNEQLYGMGAPPGYYSVGGGRNVPWVTASLAPGMEIPVTAAAYSQAFEGHPSVGQPYNPVQGWRSSTDTRMQFGQPASQPSGPRVPAPPPPVPVSVPLVPASGRSVPVPASHPAPVPISRPAPVSVSHPVPVPVSRPVPVAVPRSETVPVSRPVPVAVPRSVTVPVSRSVPASVPRSVPASVPRSVPATASQSVPASVPRSVPATVSQSVPVPTVPVSVSVPVTLVSTATSPGPSPAPSEASSYISSVAESLLQRPDVHGSGNAIPPGPTNAQLAARQVMPKELPRFSGDPQEWPIFISAFKNTTDVCGYSNAENLARLQRSLGGNALEAVRSRLLLPASVPSVMETLQRLYGRPEILINALLKRVRSVAPPRSENLHSIVTYGLAVQNLVEHIILSDQQAHLFNPMLLQELVEKLPTSMKMQWGTFKRGQIDANLATFNEFMSDQTNVASDLTIGIDAAQNHAKPARAEKGKSKEKLFAHSHESTAPAVKEKETNDRDKEQTSKACSYCEKGDHQIAGCSSFKALDVDGRWKAIRQKKLCRTCLVPHPKWPCRSKKECAVEGCRIRHHTLLHGTRNTAATTNPGETVHQHHHFSKSYTLFRYLPVTLYGNGSVVNTYVFLDDGSSSTLLEEDIAAQLGVSGEPDVLWLSWTGKIGRQEKTSQRVSVEISGVDLKQSYRLENVRTVRELGLPSQTLDYSQISTAFPHLRGLPIANYTDVKPGMIIGLEHARLLTTLKSREGGCSDPVAAKTRLGWCVYGKHTGGGNPVEQLSVHATSDVSNEQLHDAMKKFFLVEEAAVTTKVEAECDKRALEILERTTVRKTNRYETGLLWKVDNPVFPDSYPMAMKRLVSLERRLARDPELRVKVGEQIAGYEKKGYAHRATTEEIEQADPKRVWYLPLGVVTNPKKPEKVRLIWDAAARVNGTSFNDMLLKGPDFLTSLLAVLLRFRQRNIAVCGDIREMFHQILVREEDKQSQRFLWRDGPTEAAQIWVMDVATFGATCSPSIAQFVKNKHALQYSESFPRAVSIIVDDHYVDDCLFSVDTVEEAVQLTQEVKAIHAAAGFDLVKFQSNSTAVLSSLGETERLPTKQLSLDQSEESERVLGLLWIPSTDIFTFQVTTEVQQLIDHAAVPTKRQILRTVMKIFDPLGFLAHFVVHGKILMQEVWRTGTDWDEPVAEHLVDRWFRWTELLRQINEVRVPRFYFRGADLREFEEAEIHVLTDASEEAYACVAYLRIVTNEGGRCAFLAAKTKVAPLKPLSIPRLELQAAMMGARLMHTVCSALTVKISKRFLWTDSATVLAWIRSETRRYHQFVSFRVGEILSLTRMDEWRHVPSKLNVADEATKWGSGPSFDPSCRWFQGPSFLSDPEEQWPRPKNVAPETTEELREVVLHHSTVAEIIVDVERFSNWNRLQRAMAYVFKVASVGKKINRSGSVGLSKDELAKAEAALWRQAQAQAFYSEVECVRKGVPLAKSSFLYPLAPFLDEMGVMRVGGRIGAAPMVPYSTRYPVILPKTHRITALIIDSFHRKYLHANGETVCNEIKQQFFIPSLRTLVRKIGRSCQMCKVKKAVPVPPLMSPLPKFRLTPFIRPFTYVGVDYFGPLEVKVGRSVVKRWACLFTCLTIRAVHLEVCHSLSTNSCVLAIRRFVVRRGAPMEVYSDNGTNFVGANRQLSEEKKRVQQINEDCASTFTNAYTKWYFNVPAAPHMGGPWERMVRSVKTAMKVITESSRHPSDEVLETILLEAEGVINSRPLTYVPLESVDQEALTPNHFLLYSSSGIKQPVTAPVDGISALRDSWKLAQHMVDGFWRRWIREYLPMLTRRTKWFESVKPLEVGDLVIVMDENQRNHWERGRVLETFPGKDGQVRRAMVQTARGVFARPAVKLAVLDVARSNGAAKEAPETEVVHGSGDVTTTTGQPNPQVNPLTVPSSGRNV